MSFNKIKQNGNKTCLSFKRRTSNNEGHFYGRDKEESLVTAFKKLKRWKHI